MHAISLSLRSNSSIIDGEGPVLRANDSRGALNEGRRWISRLRCHWAPDRWRIGELFVLTRGTMARWVGVVHFGRARVSQGRLRGVEGTLRDLSVRGMVGFERSLGRSPLEFRVSIAVRALRWGCRRRFDWAGSRRLPGCIQHLVKCNLSMPGRRLDPPKTRLGDVSDPDDDLSRLIRPAGTTDSERMATILRRIEGRFYSRDL
jgi:hypothetical protein